MSEQTEALHHDDIQTVQHLGTLTGQVLEHPSTTARDLGHAHALGKALLGVEFSLAANTSDSIRQTGTGETP
jgi:hypothetical protein